MIPSEDPDYEHLGPAFPAQLDHAPGAILQPPKPQIRPAAKILQAAQEQNHALEAAS